MNSVPHYNAFISYRHHPEDIAVAEAIHKGLERYKIPAPLRKQGKKIQQIFRDKEELPITSSLTDTITQALRNSDYQIVICSTHLKDSYWVQREIETFLQTHTKEQVLTVIVDGEPQDVIPEILTYREVIDPVTGETVREPLEPLSCDWRIGKRKAMKTELPRLAAVLLGCTYNDLMQRQKQYRMRQLAIGASIGMAASVALAAYFLYTSIQIQNNLDMALTNQSRHLATAAQDKLDTGDRMTAIALALAALPTEESPRPYVAEAELALSDALMLYNAKEAVTAVNSFQADSMVYDFILTDDGKTLYILDFNGGVTVWDTQSFALLHRFRLTDTHDLQVTAAGNLVVGQSISGETLTCFAPDGTRLWAIDGVTGYAFNEDKSRMALVIDPEEYKDPCYLITIHPDTGTQLSDALTFEAGYSGLEFPTGAYVDGAPYLLHGYGDGGEFLLMYADGNTRVLDTSVDKNSNIFYGGCVSADGRIYLAVDDGYVGDSGRIGNVTTTAVGGVNLFCFDYNGKCLWRSHVESYVYGQWRTFEPIPGTDMVLYQYGNSFNVFHSDTGALLSHCQSAYPPVYVQVNTGNASVIFPEGSTGIFYYDSQTISSMPMFGSDISQARIKGGGYILQNSSSHVTLYRADVDDHYTAFEGELSDLARYFAVSGNRLAVVARRDVRMYDIDTHTLLWETPLEDYPTLLGYTSDGKQLLLHVYDGILSYDTATGDVALQELPPEEFTFMTSPRGIFMDGDVVYFPFYYSDLQVHQVCAWNLLTGETEYLTLPESWEHASYPTLVGLAGDVLYFRLEDGSLYAYYKADATVAALGSTEDDYPVLLQEPEGGYHLVGKPQCVEIFDREGTLLHTLPLPDTNALSMYLYDSRLFVLGADGGLYTFCDDGSLQHTTGLHMYTSFYSTYSAQTFGRTLKWGVTPDGYLFVAAMNLGNLVDLDTMTVSSILYQVEDYLPHRDSFLSTDGSELMVEYKRLSLAEVMAMGRDLLGDFTLSDAQKAAYGLN